MAYSEEVIQQAWDKGRATNDRDSNEWRMDECGAWMQRSSYESSANEFGWHIINVVAGGEDVADNLRPFHRENAFNRNTGNASCNVVADRQGIPPTARVGSPDNIES